MTVKRDTAADINSVKPEAGKAALVVGRTQRRGGATFDTYLEKKMIGSIEGKECFIKTDIAPGTYYVIATTGDADTVKITFEPDRVYYIHQMLIPGGWKGHVSNRLVTPEKLLEEFDEPLKLLVYDGTGADLSDTDYRQAVDDYERDVKKGSHNEHAGYRGAPAK
jgi:hypothetical protein